MRALITGLNGTVAPVVADVLRRVGWEILPWDRATHPISERGSVRSHLDSLAPDAILHIGMGASEWAAWLAEFAHERDIPFLFTGTVSVYGEHQVGPFGPSDLPEPTDDYGRYKLECEKSILRVNPDALICRIGWQIGDAPGSNNMVDYFHKRRSEGPLRLSRSWIPGCSFLDDTARELVRLMLHGKTGLFHLDSNPGLSLFEIGDRLARLHPWMGEVTASDDVVKNHRMVDDRVQMPALHERISALQ